MDDVFSLEDNESICIFDGNGPTRVFRIKSNDGSGPIQVDDDANGGPQLLIKEGQVGYYSARKIVINARSGGAKGTFRFVS